MNEELTRDAGSPVAVIVGLCVHGLSLARGLQAEGVTVHALEADKRLPGLHSNAVTHLELVADVNGPLLVEALLKYANKIKTVSSYKPILFLTNDKMVETVARHIAQLDQSYDVSWSKSSREVLSLLDKVNIEKHCQERSLNYPESLLLHDNAQLKSQKDELEFPLIVKPSKPLSGFKVRLANNYEELTFLLEQYQRDLPFILQRWIPGGDECLFFCALVLDQGEVVARFDGRKIESHPPAMGQTLVAEPVFDETLYECTERFFSKSLISGPASLEVKKGPDGRFWVIEPTIGRTDYWLDCCIANNINLPFVEYCLVTGQSFQKQAQSFQYIWFDTEKSPLCYLGLAWSEKNLMIKGKKPRFAYFNFNDAKPCVFAFYRLSLRLVTKIYRKVFTLMA